MDIFYSGTCTVIFIKIEILNAVFSLGRFGVAGPRRYPPLPRRYHADRDAI